MIKWIGMENVAIYNEDCIKGIRGRISSSSIDCVICDLPYYGVVKEEFDNQWKNEQEYLEWVSALTDEFDRVLKPEGSIFLFTSRQMNRKICAILDRHFFERRIIIWSRKRGFNATRGKALASGYEPIAYYCKSEKGGTFNAIKVPSESSRKEYTEGTLKDGVSLSDVWNDIPALPHNSKEKTEHPTQKPLKLIERIVDISTNEGDVVLDACIGSGTTAIACLNKGRKCIGFENDGKYFEIAEKRIEEWRI